MSSYGWTGFGRSMIVGATYLLVVPLMLTLAVVGLVSGGFALWQHSYHPLLLGLFAIMPTYIVSFFVHYYYWKYHN